MYTDAFMRLWVIKGTKMQKKGFTIIIPHPARTSTFYVNNNNINQELFFSLKIRVKQKAAIKVLFSDYCFEIQIGNSLGTQCNVQPPTKWLLNPKLLNVMTEHVRLS